MMEVQPRGTEPAAERVALNEAAFREANEAIESKADALEIDGLLPFLCECADLSCTTVLQLTRAEYEAVRERPTWFVNAAGHERAALGWGRVVETYDRYIVVTKIDVAAEVAAATDPRRAAT